MWHSFRNFYEQPRACFRRAWRSLIELPLTRSLSHLYQRSLSDCASKALAEGLLKGELRLYQNVVRSLPLPSIIVHTGDAQKKKRPEINSILLRRKRKPSEVKDARGRLPGRVCLNVFFRVKKLPSANMLLSSCTIVYISI